jgi:hypothetical protein
MLHTMHDNHTDVLLEDINSKLERLAEAMGAFRDDVTSLKGTAAPIPTIQRDVQTIKAVVTDQSKAVKALDHRVSALEQAD